MDRRAKKRQGESSERRIDGLPGTMVNFGSNRLIPEFQLAPTVWLDPVLHTSRNLAVSLSFSLLTYAREDSIL